MWRRPGWTSLLYLLSSISLFLVWPRLAWTQIGRQRSQACYATLRRFKLVSPGIGWVIVDQPAEPVMEGEECTRQHLYWTENNGETWSEITPGQMPTRSIGQIFFLNRSHGWMLSTDALSEEEGARFYLLSTTDSGRNWRTVVLQRAMFKLRDDYTFPRQVFFSDPQHGWILWHWAMMNSQLNYLLATEDAGRTWKRLPDPPGPGPLQFTSPREGWMIGGPETPQGIPDPETENLWRTHDGGLHWHVLPVSPMADSELSEIYFGEIRFKNANQGLAIAGGHVSDYVSRFFTCVTRDGGKTWSLSHFDAYHASPSFVDDHVIWSISDWPAMKVSLRTGDRLTSPVPPAGLSPGSHFGDFDFVDDSNAWTLYGRELLSTADGGNTFNVITPPALARSPFPQPQLRAVNGIMLWFPPTPLMPQGFSSEISRRQRPSSELAAGGPLEVTGSGFLQENTIWLGSQKLQTSSKDGEHLLCLVPREFPAGTYDVYVENGRGKSNSVQITVRPPETFRISGIYNRAPRYRDMPYRVDSSLHPGQQVIVTGSGFLLDNTVWFGKQQTSAKLVVSGGAGMQFDVPTSLSPGPYELYVTNANGKSNVLPVMVK